MLSHSVMTDSLRPHGLQPARLLCPWDPPGKNTGVGCHFLLQGVFSLVYLLVQIFWWQSPRFYLFDDVFSESESFSVVSDSCEPMDCGLQGSFVHGIIQHKKTGVGSLSLLQGIFPTQGLNPGLPHCRRILYHLSHQGSPRILEWVAYLFSGDLPNPGIELGSPALAGLLFTTSNTWEALIPAELWGKRR